MEGRKELGRLLYGLCYAVVPPGPPQSTRLLGSLHFLALLLFLLFRVHFIASHG